MPAFLQGKNLYIGTYFMAMYSYIPPFHEAEVCDVLLCVFDKLGCAVDEEILWITVIESGMRS
jgi:hypothetical protein